MSGFWDEMERQALYRIPLDTLELKESVVKNLNALGIDNIGSCVDYFENSAAFKTDGKVGMILWMRLVVQPRLKKLGFWKYVNQGKKDE
jgi:hypothetical protein